MNQEYLVQVEKDEADYEKALSDIADKICREREIRLALITGGSCAGKTTTTEKLARLISERGRATHVVSLDDYYRNPEETVYLPDGTRDIESINSLRLDLIHETMSDILEGREASIPVFDFKTAVRTDGVRRLKMSEGDAVLVEGLHALSPELFSVSPDRKAIFKIYLYASAGDGADCRFVRRMVRDSRHRSANAEETFRLWKHVKSNERDSIEPFRESADVAINTFFPYERSILSDDAVALLETVPEDSDYYKTARSLIALLSEAPSWPDGCVPENSLLREFM